MNEMRVATSRMDGVPCHPAEAVSDQVRLDARGVAAVQLAIAT